MAASKSERCPRSCFRDDDASSNASSPALNARVSEATPARRPLLAKKVDSPGSRFTSARSEDLHELTQIFDNARGPDMKDASPQKAKRSRFVKPSVYSLHSLQKIGSVPGLLKRRLSRNLAKSSSGPLSKGEDYHEHGAPAEPDTVVRAAQNGPNIQLKITKSDLRKDLLSDRKPEEGGYDSDAEVLQEIEKKIAKKSPSKRHSLRSIDWTASTESKQSPESAEGYNTSEDLLPNRPYQLKPHELAGHTPHTSRFDNVFSSPNLRVNTPNPKERRLRRSQSATSADLPKSRSQPLIRLPSIKADDDGTSWGEAMQESLRLSKFDISPLWINLDNKASKSFSRLDQVTNAANRLNGDMQPIVGNTGPSELSQPSRRSMSEPVRLEVHIQEPTTSTPRVSTSVKENTNPETSEDAHIPQHGRGDEDPRSSVHLHNMRISHHLRSGSLLSWENLAVSHDLPPPPSIFHERSVSGQSRLSKEPSRSRHDRQTSSSGFASSKVPNNWGRVLPPGQQREEMSSVYSSRPATPPGSLGGSMGNISIVPPDPKGTPTTVTRAPSADYPTDNEETPRPPKRYGSTNFEATWNAAVSDSLLEGPVIARNNSVATTKKSKFREEFSPPPRKRYPPSISIMNILRPLSLMRSRSEANLKPAKGNLDGTSETSRSVAHSERSVSQSVLSLQKEQQALGKDKEASPMWERALKSHQEERSSFLLPGNKSLATSPFRQRSGSTVRRPKSTLSMSPGPTQQDAEPSPFASMAHTPTIEEEDLGPSFQPGLTSRRTALVHAPEFDLDPTREIQIAFDRQTDSIETVGAWGRYPSHTREERTSSAGHADSVRTRDFALEAAVKPALKEVEEIDPTTRPESPLPPGGKRKKKRVGTGRIAKSRSMTFGKTFIKNYTKIFKSQSAEFQRYGYGHRSSIAAGGTLEFPELELVPDVWTTPIAEDDGRRRRDASSTSEDAEASPANASRNAKGKQKADDSKPTMRPPFRGRPQYTLDGVAEEVMARPADRARVWSIYYEDCVPTFPRASMDVASLSLPRPNLNDVIDLKEFGAGNMSSGSHGHRPRTGARRSIDSRRASMHSRTLSARLTSHRNRPNRRSRTSIASRASIVASLASLSLDDGETEDVEEAQGVDGSSTVSVRRSTMDLISLYRQQEIVERDRVLSLLSAESMKTSQQEVAV